MLSKLLTSPTPFSRPWLTRVVRMSSQSSSTSLSSPRTVPLPLSPQSAVFPFKITFEYRQYATRSTPPPSSPRKVSRSFADEFRRRTLLLPFFRSHFLTFSIIMLYKPILLNLINVLLTFTPQIRFFGRCLRWDPSSSSSPRPMASTTSSTSNQSHFLE